MNYESSWNLQFKGSYSSDDLLEECIEATSEELASEPADRGSLAWYDKFLNTIYHMEDACGPEGSDSDYTNFQLEQLAKTCAKECREAQMRDMESWDTLIHYFETFKVGSPDNH